MPEIGGSFTEALVNSPHLINPILATNDAERDISSLIFAGLLKYNQEGKLVPDLAESFEQSPDGKTYTILLRENNYWHDNTPLTAKDVIFTLNAIQNPEYKSPLRVNWQGVSIKTEDERKVIISLDSPYAVFAQNLTVGILPAHIWQAVMPQNFPLAEFNQKPIGSGPYRFVRLTKDKFGRIISVELETNPKYFASVPFIKDLKFISYANEEEAIAAFNRKEVDSIGALSHQSKAQLRGLGNAKIYNLPMSRIYAVFFNTDDKILISRKVRQALDYSIDKIQLAEKVTGLRSKVARGPLPSILLSNQGLLEPTFDLDKAQKLLDDDLWQKNETGLRSKKLNKKDKEATPLKLILTTANTLQLVETATLIKDYWQKLGVEVQLNVLNINELQQEYLRPRKYQVLLIGEVFGLEPDPFAFWYSKEAKDPGLNLSLYTNKKVDQILEKARQIINPQKRAQEYAKFEKIIIENAPAVFLYSPDYLYVLPEKIKGVEERVIAVSSNRFNDINKWYIKTKRVWK